MCPSCKSLLVRRSRRQNFRDFFMKIAGQVPYRCRDCNRRFFVSYSVDTVLERGRQRDKELASQLADKLEA